MAATANAPRSKRRTLRAMHTNPISRYTDLLKAIARSEIPTAPLLVFQLFTVTHHYEILDGAAVSSNGSLLIAELRFNGFIAPARAVPLARIATTMLDGRDVEVCDVLELPVAERGRYVSCLRSDLAELEISQPVHLEDIVPIAAEALLHAAADTAGRQAVLAYAGIPAATPVAAKQRALHLPESLHTVAALIDDLAASAGLRAAPADELAHA